jgi:hypothetical protein
LQAQRRIARGTHPAARAITVEPRGKLVAPGRGILRLGALGLDILSLDILSLNILGLSNLGLSNLGLSNLHPIARGRSDGPSRLGFRITLL